MLTMVESKDKAVTIGNRVWDLSQTLSRQFKPAIEISPKRESEFISRLFAMTLMAALAGGMLALLPAWPLHPWCEGALLGMVLSITATRYNPSKQFRRIGLGMVFGVGLQAFTQMGFPFVGMAVLAGGIGAQMSNAEENFSVRLDTMLTTVLTAILGAWAITRLGPLLQFTMPHSIAKASEWAVLGMFFSIGAMPLHLNILSDRILMRVRRIRRKLEENYRVYLDRMLDKYMQMGKIDLDKKPDELISFLSRKEMLGEALLETAESTLALQQVDRSLQAISEDTLKSHERELRSQYDRLKDPAIKGELDRLISGVEESITRREKLQLESERLKLQLFRIEMDIAVELPCR